MNDITHNNDGIILDGLDKYPELHRSLLQKQSSPPSNLVHVSEAKCLRDASVSNSYLWGKLLLKRL